jgi:hypothetical protein
MSPGYARSHAILEEYLDLVHGARPHRPSSISSTRMSSFRDPAKSYGSARSLDSAPYTHVQTPSSGFSSLSPSELTLPSPSSSKYVFSFAHKEHFHRGSPLIHCSPYCVTHPTSTPSPEASRATKRLPCISAQCPKTFSNVSNRNKHMREGCAFREKRGYRCRNSCCTKVLTTKWYRDTHEKERCRFRPDP